MKGKVDVLVTYEFELSDEGMLERAEKTIEKEVPIELSSFSADGWYRVVRLSGKVVRGGGGLT